MREDISRQKARSTRIFFVINNSSLFGYFSKNEKLPFRVTVKKPRQFFGATSLYKQVLNDSMDYYETGNYAKLVDNPILYSVPDTSNLDLNGLKVCVAVFFQLPRKNSTSIGQPYSIVIDKTKNIFRRKVANFKLYIYNLSQRGYRGR